MPREQRTSKGMDEEETTYHGIKKDFERRLYGGREETTMLYGGGGGGQQQQTSYVAPRKHVKIPGVANHADSSTVDFIMSSHREANKEKQRKAIQNNREFQEIQRLKAEKVEAEKRQALMNRQLQEVYDGRGMRVNQEPVQRTPRQDQNQNEQDDFFSRSFGRPGGGAPQRTTSGKLRTGLQTDASLRMNNGVSAEIEANRLRNLEKKNSNNSMGTNTNKGSLTARLGFQEQVYDPWGKGAGNPNRDSAGKCRGMRRTDPNRGGVPVDNGAYIGNGLVTESRYGGGGGQPMRGPNGELLTTRASHFSKDAQGNDTMKNGDPFATHDSSTTGKRGTTFGSYTDAIGVGDLEKKGAESPLEQEARERKQRMANRKRIENMIKPGK